MAMELTTEIWRALGGPDAVLDDLAVIGEGALPSAYRVTDLATASIASAALAVSELLAAALPGETPVTVDRRLASFWFAWSIRPIGWRPAAAWDPIAGDYRTSDGWIRLHTNAPHHRAAAQRVLGPHQDKAAMASAVESWTKHELEDAVVAAGGCAAEMRSASDWAEHRQGRAVAAEPLAYVTTTAPAAPLSWVPTRERPLAGLRVLDLTRVLAGPIATRFLASYGAEVLRIDPPDWDEAGVIPEVTLGKRCVRLDLKTDGGRQAFEALLSKADILLHGYRPGALDALGYGAAARRALSPNLIDVSLNAYGWTGPWSGRRGFDSLMQMSAGIAETGMRWKGADRPIPLPVQALDHATGYLMAAVAIRAVTRRLTGGQTTAARLSLARTAKLLADAGGQDEGPALAAETELDRSPDIEETSWGPARRLRPPASVAGAPMRWDYPARELGWSEADWV